MTMSEELMEAAADGGASAEAQAEAFVGGLFLAGLGAFELLNVYVGDRLGLYRALDGAGGLTTAELAAAAGIDERYAREWLDFIPVRFESPASCRASGSGPDFRTDREGPRVTGRTGAASRMVHLLRTRAHPLTLIFAII